MSIINQGDLVALWTTLQLASLSTAILILIGIPMAWWLTRTSSPLKPIIQAMVALPLILPPTVLGFYLLLWLGPHGSLGQLSIFFTGQSLAFSFSGLVVGSIIYSLPFVVQPLYLAFHNIGRHHLELSATLGTSSWRCFFTVVLPMAKTGIYTAGALAFAHTIGEFGVILMIGGNIPGETRVVSVAIYDYVDSLQYMKAHVLSGFLLVFSFIILTGVFLINRRHSVPKS